MSLEYLITDQHAINNSAIDAFIPWMYIDDDAAKSLFCGRQVGFMKVDYMFLADAGIAQVDTGLFTVLNGGVNLVRCPQFPGGLHTVFLLGRVSFEPAECSQKHFIDVEVMGPSDSVLDPAFRRVELSPGPSDLGKDRRSLMTFALTFQSLVFPTPGVYTFRVLRSGERDVIGTTTIDALPARA
jgi:hypothetical protein